MVRTTSLTINRLTNTIKKLLIQEIGENKTNTFVTSLGI